jgi:hypothetical protein
LKLLIGLGAVAHTCNPSYSESIEQEEHDLKSGLAKSETTS